LIGREAGLVNESNNNINYVMSGFKPYNSYKKPSFRLKIEDATIVKYTKRARSVSDLA
jgi:hypothetical protein